MAKELNKEQVNDLAKNTSFLIEGSDTCIEMSFNSLSDLSDKIGIDNFGTVHAKDDRLREVIKRLTALKELKDEATVLLEILKYTFK